MVVIIVKVYIFGKKFYLFVISLKRKCNLFKNVVEIELIYFNLNVYIVIINLLFMI